MKDKVHPMVPFLAGYLMCSLHDGPMKVVDLVPDVPAAFEVKLASGMILRVEVSQKQPEAKP